MEWWNACRPGRARTLLHQAVNAVINAAGRALPRRSFSKLEGVNLPSSMEQAAIACGQSATGTKRAAQLLPVAYYQGDAHTAPTRLIVAAKRRRVA